MDRVDLATEGIQAQSLANTAEVDQFVIGSLGRNLRFKDRNLLMRPDWLRVVSAGNGVRAV